MKKGTAILPPKRRRGLMAKFNKGEAGGIRFKARPVGFRRWLWLHKIVPYLVGYDVKVDLSLSAVDGSDWLPDEGVLRVITPPGMRPRSDANKSFDIEAKATAQRAWLSRLHVCHAAFPGQLSCELCFNKLALKDDGVSTRRDTIDVEIIGDLRVLSLHTIFAWAVPIVVLGVIGILNLVWCVG